MWGLGAADMKAGVAVMLEIAVQLARQGIIPPQDLVLVLTADEEVAYRGAATVAQSGHIDDADVLIITEPTAHQVYIGQKGELWVEISFCGQEVHGSIPELGTNAILPAAQFCTRLQAEVSLFEEVSGRGRTSLSVGQFNGGRQVNIVPDLACVRIDVRVVSGQEKNHMMKLVDQIARQEAERVGATYKTEIINYKPPIVSDINNCYVRHFFQVFHRTTNVQPDMRIAPYSTDAVSIVPHGISRW